MSKDSQKVDEIVQEAFRRDRGLRFEYDGEMIRAFHVREVFLSRDELHISATVPHGLFDLKIESFKVSRMSNVELA